MSEIIPAVVIGALAFVGLGSLISALCMYFYHTEKGVEEYIILPVIGHIEDIEFHIRGTAFRRRRMKNKAKIYLVDLGADNETAEIAKRMIEEFEGMEWVSGSELVLDIKNDIREKTKK